MNVRISLLVGMICLFFMAAPHSAPGQSEETKFKELIFKKLKLNVDKSRLAWKKSRKHFDDDLADTLAEQMKDSEIQFNRDGTVSVDSPNLGKQESKWEKMEFDTENKVINFKLDSQDTKIVLNDDGDFEIHSDAIVLIAEIVDQEKKAPQKAHASPKGNDPEKSVPTDKKKPSLLIVGKWRADQIKTISYLKDFSGSNDLMRDEVRAICKREMRMEIFPDRKIQFQDTKGSRKSGFSISETQTIRKQTHLSLTLEKSPNKGTLRLVIVDQDTIAVLPKFSREDDPPILFSRETPVTAEKASPKLDKANAKKLLIGDWSFDLDESIAYLESNDKFDEETITDFEDNFGDGEELAITFGNDGELIINTFGDETESTFEVRRVAIKNQRAQISLRIKDEELDDTMTFSVTVIEDNKIAIVADGEPPMVFIKD